MRLYSEYVIVDIKKSPRLGALAGYFAMNSRWSRSARMPG